MEKLSGNLKIDVDQDIIEKMKQTYLACPMAVKYINSLGIPAEEVDSNIAKIYDFVRDVNYCKHCPGLNNCLKPDAHLCTKIIYEDGVVERQLTPCKELIKKMEFIAEFKIRDFDKSWLDISLKDIDSSNERKQVLAKYLKIIKEGSNEWIYLTGEQNTGRSYFACALAVDLARKNKGPIAFINTALRIKELVDYSYKKQDEFNKLLATYETVPILILDDFGNEFKTDFVRDALIFEILNKRSAAHLLTIFTSDFPINDIVALYSTNKSAAIRARQIGKIIRNNAKEEISLGEISIY